MDQHPDAFATFLSNLGDNSVVLRPADVVVALALAFALSILVAYVYRATHRGISYSQAFAQTLVLLGTLVALIMMMVGSNVARAFALAGTLGIVRFRTAVKETRDLVFVFLSVALGMACGTRFYFLAVLAGVCINFAVVTMFKLDLFRNDVRDRILRIRMPAGTEHQFAFDAVMKRHLKDVKLISVETVAGGGQQEAVYSVNLRKAAKEQELLEGLRNVNGNSKVALVMGHHEGDL